MYCLLKTSPQGDKEIVLNVLKMTCSFFFVKNRGKDCWGWYGLIYLDRSIDNLVRRAFARKKALGTRLTFRTTFLWIQNPYLLRMVAQYKKFANQVIECIKLVSQLIYGLQFPLTSSKGISISGQHAPWFVVGGDSELFQTIISIIFLRETFSSIFISQVSPEDHLALEVITYIGCGISFIALTAAIIIFLSLRFVQVLFFLKLGLPFYRKINR